MTIVDINTGRFLEGSPKLDYTSVATAIGLMGTIKQRLDLFRRAINGFYEAERTDNVREMQPALEGVNSVSSELKKSLVKLLKILLNKSGFTLDNSYLQNLIIMVREIGRLERKKFSNQIKILYNDNIGQLLDRDNNSSPLAKSLAILESKIKEKKPFFNN